MFYHALQNTLERDVENLEDEAEHRLQAEIGRRRQPGLGHRAEQPVDHAAVQVLQDIAEELHESLLDRLQDIQQESDRVLDDVAERGDRMFAVEGVTLSLARCKIFCGVTLR